MSKLEELRKKAMALPEQPGVYIMKNADGDIIYIGKAKILKNRVSQYFGSQNNHPSKVRRMVENVFDFDYIIVSSEFEALVLECSLIKEHTPKYNILLKDDKGYSYIKVGNKSWKSISSVFRKDDEDASYYGPYMASDTVYSALKEAMDIFQLPHCNKRFPEDIRKKGRPCLNYHIKLCSGACAGIISREEHNRNVDEALRFVLGGRNKILNELKTEMNKAAESLEFERAAKLRDKIQSIEKISRKQNVVDIKYKNQDVFGIESIGDKSCVNVLTVRKGTIVSTENYITDRLENGEEELIQLLANYYSGRTDFPDRICIEEEISDTDMLFRYLDSLSSKKIRIYSPKAGEGLSLMELAKRNASEKLSRVLTAHDKKRAVLLELKELLGLEKIPSVIEAYDISNMSGSENVGGMITFVDGKPDKKRYRRFEIKGFIGQDDYRSLAEVMERRINEYRENKGTDNSFGIMPDLILIDGGAGQVNAVEPVMKRMGFDVPVFGMVKDGKHRTRAITSVGNEISINDNRSVFTLVSDIQEEVHRYAIGYHRKLKEKNTFSSQLLQIPGVGEQRAKKLLLKFGSMSKLREADVEELMQVQGISEATAEIIYKYLRML